MRKTRRLYNGSELALSKNIIRDKVPTSKCRGMERRSRQERPEELPYYHDGEPSAVSRTLSKAGLGSFLLRAASSPGSYALLVNTGKVIQKFLIETTESGRYRLGPRTFSSIEDIVDRYSSRPIADDVSLLRPAISASPTTTSSLRSSPTPVPEIALLHVTIEKFISDNLLRCDSLYSASLLVDGVRVFSSRSFSPISTRNQSSSIIFDSSYLATCAPTALCAVQIVLSSVSNTPNCFGGFGVLKRALPRTTTAMSRQFLLQGDTDIEETPENGFWARVRRTTVKVLPASQYIPLLDLIRQDGYQLYEWAWERLPSAQRPQFVLQLWKMYLTHSKELSELIVAVLQRTIAASTNASPLRSDSFCTALLGVGLKRIAATQLESQFNTSPLSTILTKKNVQSNDVDAIVEALVRLALETPVFRILALIASVSRNQYPEDPFTTMRVLASVFVLRFANPALLQLQEWQGTNQLAKMIQTAANCACSPNLDEANCSAATASFRRLFETLYVADADGLGGVDTEWSCECSSAMAIIAHLITSILPAEEATTTRDLIYEDLKRKVLFL